MNIPSSCQIQENSLPLVESYKDFNHQEVYESVLQMIRDIKNNKSLHQDDYCRCSRFDLTELVRDASAGRFFPEESAHNPESLAYKITVYLYSQLLITADKNNSL